MKKSIITFGICVVFGFARIFNLVSGFFTFFAVLKAKKHLTATKSISSKAFLGLVALTTVVGCTSSRYLVVKKVTVEQKESKEGVVTNEVKEVKKRADRNVIETSTNVKSVTRITDFQKKKAFDRFSVSHDGKKLLIPVFEGKGEEMKSQIWTLGTNGVGLSKVTSGRYWDLDPVFSSDGKYIYFSSNRGDDRPKIWRVHATGTGGLTRVTSSNTSDRTPSVGSMRSTLVYSALMPGTSEWQIWTVNTNGSLPTQLVIGSKPVYSPDGKKILYVKNNKDTKKFDLWIMNEDGSRRTQMTNGEANCIDPRWSMDGRRILFASDKGRDEEHKHNFDIWLMDADGTNVTQLTTNGSHDDSPVFDPEGRYVYFASNRGGGWDIWRMELTSDNGGTSDSEVGDGADPKQPQL